jgi:FAD synthase
MEIIKLGYNHSITLSEEIIATIGEFDGIHIAHQMLFDKTIELAKSCNKKSAVITFDLVVDFDAVIAYIDGTLNGRIIVDFK